MSDGELVCIRTRRTNSTRSRAAAIAVIGATPTAMLDAIISRAEAARTRYLGHLSQPRLRTFPGVCTSSS